MKFLTKQLRLTQASFIYQERFHDSTPEDECPTDPYEELLQEIEQEQNPIQQENQMSDYQKWELLQEQEPIFLEAFGDLRQEFYKIDDELYKERKQGVEINYTKYEQHLVNAYVHLCTLDTAYQKIKAVGLHNIQPFDKASFLHSQYSLEKYGYKEGIIKKLSKSNEQLGGIEDEYVMAKAIVIEMEHLILDRAEGEKTVGVMVRENADGSYEYFSKQYGVSDKSQEFAEKGIQPKGIGLSPQLQHARSSIEHIDLIGDEKASWGAKLLCRLRAYFIDRKQ